jgi:hypothetical protein
MGFSPPQATALTSKHASPYSHARKRMVERTARKQEGASSLMAKAMKTIKERKQQFPKRKEKGFKRRRVAHVVWRLTH